MRSPVLLFAFLSLVTALLVCMIFLAGCVGAQQPKSPGKLDGFDDFVTQKMAEYEVPGAVVGIVENDTVVYLKGFGVREIGKPERSTPTPASRSHRSPSMSPPVRSALLSTRGNLTGTHPLSRTCRVLR